MAVRRLSPLLLCWAAWSGSFAAGAGPKAMATIELPGHSGRQVNVTPLVPQVERGRNVGDPDKWLRPQAAAEVREGRVRLALGGDPVLLSDPAAPPAPERTDPGSPFCMAAASPQPFVSYAEVARQLRDLRVCRVRGTGLGAARLGVWLGSGVAGLGHVDETVRSGQGAGCDVVLVLHAAVGGPRSGRRSGTRMPDLGKWRRFVADVVERYDADGQRDMPGLRRPVVGYVVHNEPDFRRFWADTAENYGRLVAETAKVVKAVDGRAKVILAGTAGSVASYLRAGEDLPKQAPDPQMVQGRTSRYRDGKLLAAAKKASRELPTGRRFVDVMDFHFYEDAHRWAQLALLGRYAKRTAADAGWPWCEVWCMETGTWGPAVGSWGGRGRGRPDQTERQQARSLVKRYVYGRAHGVTRIWWFGVKVTDSMRGPGPFDSMALMVGERPRLAYYAYRAMARLLSGCQWSETKIARDGQDGVYVVRFWRGGRAMWVAWRE